MFAKFSTLLVSCLAAAVAQAADLGATTISDAHIRPSNAQVAVGFFTVTAPSDDAIVGVTAECCKAAELHRTERINGAMTMRRVSEQPLRKGKALKVQPDEPGGEHLMLIGLKRPLDEGDSVPVTFTFKKAGEQTVTFSVYADRKPDGHTH